METAVTAPQTQAAQMLQLVNQFRADNGLPAFQPNAALSAAAQNQANYMAEFSVYSSHVGYGGSTPQTRADAAGYGGFVSENIVGGTSMTAPQGLTWWRNSPVHYNTLVTSRYSEAGAGFATNGESNFFVLVVGRKATAQTAPPSGEDSSPAPLYVEPIALAAPAEDGSIVHTVGDGQALWTLAAYYDVSLSDLLLYNNLSETDFLQPGDTVLIRLADGAPPPPTPTPPLRHTVQAGQSLWSIALRYDLRFNDLLLFNGLNEDSLLQPGDEIVIRLAEGEAAPPTPTPVVFHAIRANDTLLDIALRYGLSLDQLLALNPGLTVDTILQIDQTLQVREVVPTVAVVETTVPPTTTPAPPTTTPTNQPTIQPTTEIALAATQPPQPDPAPTTPTTTRISSTLLFTIAALLATAGVGFIWWANRESE